MARDRSLFETLAFQHGKGIIAFVQKQNQLKWKKEKKL